MSSLQKQNPEEYEAYLRLKFLVTSDKEQELQGYFHKEETIILGLLTDLVKSNQIEERERLAEKIRTALKRFRDVL